MAARVATATYDTNSFPQPQQFTVAAPMATGITTSGDDFVRRIADYERISGILWLIIGIIQVLTIIGVVAGIWNIVAATTRFRRSTQVRARHPGIPKAFEPIVGLVVVGVINLIFGGIIGVFFVGFDFYIRDQVLSHAHLFRRQPMGAAAC
jgi:hypothetical protein